MSDYPGDDYCRICAVIDLVFGPDNFPIELPMQMDTTDLSDDYGIESADIERLVHTPWACGFTNVNGVAL